MSDLIGESIRSAASGLTSSSSYFNPSAASAASIKSLIDNPSVSGIGSLASFWRASSISTTILSKDLFFLTFIPNCSAYSANLALASLLSSRAFSSAI
uniref:ORF 2 n=1 Tax=Enterobacteria phage T4 TaxID=10665 RepID=Q37881_BPT4|nr:unnamed protein product [Tequatrovirus T4]